MKIERETGDRLLRGAARIGAAIGMKPGAAHYALQKNRIECARKIGMVYVAPLKALRREFGLEE